MQAHTAECLTRVDDLTDRPGAVAVVAVPILARDGLAFGRARADGGRARADGERAGRQRALAAGAGAGDQKQGLQPEQTLVLVQPTARVLQLTQTVLAFVPPAASLRLHRSRFLRVSALSDSFFDCFLIASPPVTGAATECRVT
jgi:hypothetical protein